MRPRQRANMANVLLYNLFLFGFGHLLHELILSVLDLLAFCFLGDEVRRVLGGIAAGQIGGFIRFKHALTASLSVDL